MVQSIEFAPMSFRTARPLYLLFSEIGLNRIGVVRNAA